MVWLQQSETREGNRRTQLHAKSTCGRTAAYQVHVYQLPRLLALTREQELADISARLQPAGANRDAMTCPGNNGPISRDSEHACKVRGGESMQFTTSYPGPGSAHHFVTTRQPRFACMQRENNGPVRSNQHLCNYQLTINTLAPPSAICSAAADLTCALYRDPKSPARGPSSSPATALQLLRSVEAAIGLHVTGEDLSFCFCPSQISGHGTLSRTLSAGATRSRNLNSRLHPNRK